MTDIVKRLREAQFARVFDDALLGRDPLPLGAAADEIERLRAEVAGERDSWDAAWAANNRLNDECARLRAVLRRALHLHDIEQAERPTPNVPAWVEDARTLLTEARDA